MHALVIQDTYHSTSNKYILQTYTMHCHHTRCNNYYKQYDRNPKNFYDLDIKAIFQKNNRKIHDKLQEGDRQVLELDFGNNPDKLQGEYLDMCGGVRSEVLWYTWSQFWNTFSSVRNPWKCRLSLRYKEHIWTRGYYTFMRIMLWFSK